MNHTGFADQSMERMHHVATSMELPFVKMHPFLMLTVARIALAPLLDCLAQPFLHAQFARIQKLEILTMMENQNPETQTAKFAIAPMEHLFAATLLVLVLVFHSMSQLCSKTQPMPQTFCHLML